MDLGKLLEALVNRGKLLRRIIYVVLAGLVIADIVIPSAYDRFPWESIGGFGAFYGFVSCVLIIVVSKALGYVALYRNEDYYENDGGSAGERGGDNRAASREETGGTTTFETGANSRDGGSS